jgi:uncharacterized protein (DUF983 family)
LRRTENGSTIIIQQLFQLMREPCDGPLPLDQGAPISANIPDALPVRRKPSAEESHPFPPGVGRGLARRCPNCGNGRLFDGYLRPICDHCGNDNDRYPADDALHITILLVGHIVVAPMLMLHAIRIWPLWLSLSLFAHVRATPPLTRAPQLLASGARKRDRPWEKPRDVASGSRTQLDRVYQRTLSRLERCPS